MTTSETSRDDLKPKISEFIIFISCLRRSAPDGYIPWLFRLASLSKAPALEFGSWKAERNRLSVTEAVEWLRQGGNIGIAGMKNDPLVNIDLDGKNVQKETLKPTLTTRSRSRTGIHGFYFTKNKENIPNIPTDDDGEVRCCNQYVVCAGSYVPTDPNTVPVEYRDTAGYYTVEDRQAPAWITFDELPEVFRKKVEKNQQAKTPKPRIWKPIHTNKKHSALFDIEARDVVSREGGELNPTKRWSCLFHDSKTESNMSLSQKGLLQCWRHNVSHNGLQALVVLSGYMSCEQAGSPHRGSGASPSAVSGDDGAIFHAWLYAKNNGYIPLDDPIPVRAMHYIAEKHGLYKPKRDELLPRWVYKRVLEIVEEEY